MRRYVTLPILVGSAFAVLYGAIGLLASILDAAGWVEELQFHILGIHFGGVGVTVVSLALLALAGGAMSYLMRSTAQPA